MNVLIIEDDLLLRRLMGHSLLESGHHVSSTANGQEALNVIANNSTIDLIICDVMMPVVSGPGFLLQLKSHFPKGLPKILIISAIKDGESFLKKLEVQYDYFLQKPFEFAEFDAVMNKLKKSNS
jgi:DNA-binding response OmpR family regulator